MSDRLSGPRRHWRLCVLGSCTAGPFALEGSIQAVVERKV